MRFEMARALVRRARERATWIGDDHGDPYEEALLTRSVSIEMHVALKEILDHLRSALDYCAHEVCETATGQVTSTQIYFPITAREFAAADFRSRVGKLMPGLLQARPDLVPVLAQFQPFASPDNQWLADLATLANRTKHVEFDVHSVDAVPMVISAGPDGMVQFSVCRADGRVLPIDSLRLIEGDYHVGSMNCRIVYLNLTPIDEELLGFLKRALDGVDRAIDTLEAAL